MCDPTHSAGKLEHDTKALTRNPEIFDPEDLARTVNPQPHTDHPVAPTPRLDRYEPAARNRLAASFAASRREVGS